MISNGILRDIQFLYQHSKKRVHLLGGFFFSFQSKYILFQQKNIQLSNNNENMYHLLLWFLEHLYTNAVSCCQLFEKLSQNLIVLMCMILSFLLAYLSHIPVLLFTYVRMSVCFRHFVSKEFHPMANIFIIVERVLLLRHFLGKKRYKTYDVT